MGTFLLSLTKFVLAFLLIPVVAATALGFWFHLDAYSSAYTGFFFWGIYALLFTFLFIYQYWGIYEFGQRMISGALRFLSPVDKFLAQILPFYFLLTALLGYVNDRFLEMSTLEPYLMFFMGLFLAMHVLLTAQDLQQREATPIKPNYLFMAGIIFIANIFLTVLCLDFIFDTFTFPEFFGDIAERTTQYYKISIDKLLLF